MNSAKSIIYVNYSPYENSGKILDYILENFENVFLFSIGFYNLRNKRNYNILSIYKDGKLQKTYSLFQLPISSKFVFLLIPIKSVITFLEIIFYSIWLKIKLKRIDIYFTVNAFTAWIGSILKAIGVIEKTIFWVWDYYPPIHENKIVMLMRYIYWQFDKISSHSDRVAFVNRRLLDLRKDIGIFQKDAQYPIVPIGTDKLPYTHVDKKSNKKVLFGFIGVLKKSQGVEIVFDNADELLKEFGDIGYEIVGSGPDEDYFRERAKMSDIHVKFYGYLEGESFNDVLRKCTIGIATYVPDVSNVSHYGDPGKIKRYLSLGIPVIATNILEFSNEIEKSGAGVIIDYYNPNAFVNAVKKIMGKHSEYSKNAYALSKKYYYKKIYPRMFTFT